MSANEEVARQFEEIADLLDLQGETFKPQAYRRAARSILTLGEDLRKVAARGKIDEIPGVGEALAAKIREYLATGKIHHLEELRRECPPGLIDLMQLPGVGPKTARRFWLELGIEGPAELSAAIASGKLVGVRGFAERKIELLKDAVGMGARTSGRGRLPLLAGWEVAQRLVARLSSEAPVVAIAPAGSLRRCRESVGDLDILATSNEPARVFDALARADGLKQVVLRGDTKMTVVVEPGLQVDLRVVEPEAFGAALQYFTGSKDHNIRLRTLAREKGLKVNEYGVWRGETRLASETEEEVYRALGLPLIPPEIRENMGEIDRALAGTLPPLVERAAIGGDLHAHLPDRPGRTDIDRWRAAAAEEKMGYLGLVLPPRLETLPAAARSPEGRKDAEKVAAHVGIERPLDGTTRPLPEGVDYWVGVPIGREPPKETRFDPAPLFVAHLPLDPPGGESDPARTRRWVDWSKRSGVPLEVTPHGAPDGLDSSGVQAAQEAGVLVAVSAGAREPAELARIALSVGIARRGWLEDKGLLNRQGGWPRSAASRSSARVR